MNHFKGDIFSVTEGVILHQVNCQGVMGKGIALEVKTRYPEVFNEYKKQVTKHLESGHLSKSLLGGIIPVKVSDTLVVINCFGQNYFAPYPGKEHQFTSYDAMLQYLFRVKDYCSMHKISLDKVHHPMLGCGLGGANWNVVQPMIDQVFENQSNLWELPVKLKEN